MAGINDRERWAGWMYLYVLGLAAAGVIVFFGFVPRGQPLASPRLAWWMIAVAFAAAEACVVHLEYRAQWVWFFSLTSVAMMFGLLFASPGDLVLGALAGSALVFRWRRTSLPKVAHKCATLALALAVAVIVARAIAPAGGPGALTWLGAFAGVLAAAVVTLVCIIGTVAISEDDVRLGVWPRALAMDLAVAAVMAGVGLAAALVVSVDAARAVPVLVVLALALLAAYRSHLAERRRQNTLKLLDQTASALARSPDLSHALETLLTCARDGAYAESAEAIVTQPDGPPLRTAVGHRAGSWEIERQPPQPADPVLARELLGLVDDEHPVVALRPPLPTRAPGHRVDQPRRAKCGRGDAAGPAAPARNDHGHQPCRPGTLVPARGPAPAPSARQPRRSAL